MITLTDGDLQIRTIKLHDLLPLWEAAYQAKEPEWMKWNGPYFNDPVYSQEEFMTKVGLAWVNQKDIALIAYKGEILGTISWYWEDGSLQEWLEFGLVFYATPTWGRGLGTRACRLWLDYLFTSRSTLQRAGFTTWSGNKRMMAVGEKLGMRLEGQIRKVRRYQGVYYDSIKYGILREEWLK